MTRGIENSLLSLQGVTDLANDLVDSSLGSLSPLNNFGRYLTGSRAIIKLNDELFGFAFGVSFNISTANDEIWTIDDWTPFELAPKRISVDGTLSMFHIPGKGPTRELVQANVLSFLFHKYITIEIQDQTTGQKIFETRKAVITSRRQSINAGELSKIELTWKSIGWIDELTPFYPQGYDKKDGTARGGKTLSSLAKSTAESVGKLFG
jgi:hypothetical protein